MSELSTALDAAHAAGAVLREHWPAEREVRIKGRRDIVTEADLAAQATIITRLRNDFPSYSILAEEGEPIIGAGDLCPTWVVDPLDGTTNYARRLPLWGVAIGLLSGEALRVGVVYDPLHDVTYYAEQGAGAFCVTGSGNAPERLAVSNTSQLSQALVAMDWAHADAVRSEVAGAVGRVAMICTTVRGIGSATLAMCHLAAGRVDAYFNFDLKPWDIAATALIVAEAGGRITAPDGGPWHLGEPRLAISNGLFHNELLSAIRG